jgi:hypothetical protein
MITKQKLKIYKSWKGDIDMFIRAGRVKEKLLFNETEWHLIDILLQDATVINRNLGSPERTAQAWKRLEENCEDDTVVAEIRRLAEIL